MNSGIYSITSSSGKIYIGSAQNFARRWYLHVKALKNGNHHNKPLQAAYVKYGIEGLKFSVMIVCRVQDLLFYEQRSIDTFDPDYNICRVAGSQLGVKRTAEYKALMSELITGKKHSKEALEKLSKLWKGRKHTEESRARMSLAQKGRIVSDEARANISASSKGRRHTEESKKKMRIASSGRRHSKETIEKMKIVQKGKIVSEETREKLRLAFAGKKRAPFSEETIERMRAAARLREAKKKERKAA